MHIYPSIHVNPHTCKHHMHMNFGIPLTSFQNRFCPAHFQKPNFRYRGTFNFQQCKRMAVPGNPPPPTPKVSWAALWLWYRTVRGVESSHRQRVHLSRLLGGQMWEGSLLPPIIELLWLNPPGPGLLQVWMLV